MNDRRFNPSDDTYRNIRKTLLEKTLGDTTSQDRILDLVKKWKKFEEFQSPGFIHFQPYIQENSEEEAAEIPKNPSENRKGKIEGKNFSQILRDTLDNPPENATPSQILDWEKKISKIEASIDRDLKRKNLKGVKQSFQFCAMTKHGKYLLERYGGTACIELDASGNTNASGYPLFFLVVKDSLKKIRVCGAFLLQFETDLEIAGGIYQFSSKVECLASANWVLDDSPAEQSGLYLTLPDANQFLCHLHKKRDWKKFSKSKKDGIKVLPDENDQNEFVQRMTDTFINPKSLEEHKKSLKSLRRSRFGQNEEIRHYIDTFAVPKVLKTAAFVRKNSLISNTSNGVESSFGGKKKRFYHIIGFKSLDNCCDITCRMLIKEQGRYEDDHSNASGLKKRYKNARDLKSSWFLNKPPHIKNEVLQRVTTAKKEFKSGCEITKLSVNFFKIDGHKLDLETCKCTCLDFIPTRPCKHFFKLKLKNPDSFFLENFPTIAHNSIDISVCQNAVSAILFETTPPSPIVPFSFDINEIPPRLSETPIRHTPRQKIRNLKENIKKHCLAINNMQQNTRHPTDLLDGLTEIEKDLHEIRQRYKNLLGNCFQTPESLSRKMSCYGRPVSNRFHEPLIKNKPGRPSKKKKIESQRNSKNFYNKQKKNLPPEMPSKNRDKILKKINSAIQNIKVDESLNCTYDFNDFDLLFDESKIKIAASQVPYVSKLKSLRKKKEPSDDTS